MSKILFVEHIEILIFGTWVLLIFFSPKFKHCSARHPTLEQYTHNDIVTFRVFMPYGIIYYYTACSAITTSGLEYLYIKYYNA